jgi:ubiquinone/menaquinone biosynthesis C-methylase UbiE
MHSLQISVLLLVICTLVLPACAEDAKETEKAPPALQEYKGRELARTMHYLGAPWLIRKSRENEERCSLMLANLGIKRGDTICDLGCGNGFYALQMAKMTGEKGKVLCVDIQPEMLDLLKERAQKEKVDNVEMILGKLWDPNLPAGKVDLILLVDVYHEFSHPEHMLKAMHKSLAPGGRIALLEYRMEDPNVPIKRLHKMSKKQIMKEFPPMGFKLVKEFEKLPWQHMMFFEKDEEKKVAP